MFLNFGFRYVTILPETDREVSTGNEKPESELGTVCPIQSTSDQKLTIYAEIDVSQHDCN
jgi:hypothetical protein